VTDRKGENGASTNSWRERKLGRVKSEVRRKDEHLMEVGVAINLMPPDL
jgi:hypothetical protein